MNILFTQVAWKDFEWFLDNDKQIATRIRKLLKDVIRDPEEGIGKPEKLKFQLSGYWSRRINQEHRLVYKVEGENIIVLSCRYHYDS
ncbi:MAG: Txe/YoeB family addiction module toxin [Syntrophobacteraceae bacterium]